MVELLCNAPLIHRILVELPNNPLRNLNAYVVQDGGESLVVDTGFNQSVCRESLLTGLEELGIDWKRTKLFLTHLHSDHIGLVWEFLQRGSTVYMHETDYDAANRGYPEKWKHLEEVYSREGFPDDVMALQQSGNQARAYAPGFPFPAQTVRHGTILPVGRYELHCIHTPGHTPGHTMLYLPEQQLLFSGDHILFDISPNIGIWERFPHSLEHYLDSLKKTRDLPVRQTFPAHRNCKGELSARVDQLLEHHRARLAELLEAVRQHPGSSGYTLAGYLTWSARGAKWEEFSPHQKWFATGETLAHLYYLTEHGQIRREEKDGKFFYTL